MAVKNATKLAVEAQQAVKKAESMQENLDTDITTGDLGDLGTQEKKMEVSAESMNKLTEELQANAGNLKDMGSKAQELQAASAQLNEVASSSRWTLMMQAVNPKTLAELVGGMWTGFIACAATLKNRVLEIVTKAMDIAEMVSNHVERKVLDLPQVKAVIRNAEKKRDMQKESKSDLARFSELDRAGGEEVDTVEQLKDLS